MPGSSLSRYSPVPGGSVPLCWVTRYCSGESLETASGSFGNIGIRFSSFKLHGSGGLALAGRGRGERLALDERQQVAVYHVRLRLADPMRLARIHLERSV